MPGQRLWTASPSEIAFHAVFQGVFSTILSTLAYTRAVRALGAARTAIATSLAPAAAALLAVPIAGEIPSGPNALGLLLVTLGMLVGASAPAGAAPSPALRSEPGRD
jgi:drug/metabolite transporter (DMT)-like permease